MLLFQIYLHICITLFTLANILAVVPVVSVWAISNFTRFTAPTRIARTCTVHVRAMSIQARAFIFTVLSVLTRRTIFGALKIIKTMFIRSW